MRVTVEHHEYDCWTACTTDGCPGHVTDIPIGIEIDGIMFWVDGFDSGSYPGQDEKDIEDVKKVVDDLETELQIAKAAKEFMAALRIHNSTHNDTALRVVSEAKEYLYWLIDIQKYKSKPEVA